MAQHTWGGEMDPRLNQADIYCEECGELCGRGARQVQEAWYCLACVVKENDGPQDDRHLERGWQPDPLDVMREAKKLKGLK